MTRELQGAESLCLDSTRHQIVGQLNGRSLISVMVTETQRKSINAVVLCLIDTKMGDLIMWPFDIWYRWGQQWHLLLRLPGTSSPEALFSAIHNFVKVTFQTKQIFRVALGVCLRLNSLQKVSARTVQCLPRTMLQKNTLFYTCSKLLAIFSLTRCSRPILGHAIGLDFFFHIRDV